MVWRSICAQRSDPVSATDEDRLAPGGFGLSYAFPHWFGRPGRIPFSSKDSLRNTSGSYEEETAGSNSAASADSGAKLSSDSETPVASGSTVIHVLDYMRQAFHDEKMLDDLPVAAAANLGAWKAWQAYRRRTRHNAGLHRPSNENPSIIQGQAPMQRSETPDSHSDEWSWDGVWEQRVRKGVHVSVSDQVLFGAGGGNGIIRFHEISDDAVAAIKHLLEASQPTLTVIHPRGRETILTNNRTRPPKIGQIQRESPSNSSATLSLILDAQTASTRMYEDCNKASLGSLALVPFAILAIVVVAAFRCSRANSGRLKLKRVPGYSSALGPRKPKKRERDSAAGSVKIEAFGEVEPLPRAHLQAVFSSYPSVVSSSSKQLVFKSSDVGLVPEPLRIQKRKRGELDQPRGVKYLRPSSTPLNSRIIDASFPHTFSFTERRSCISDILHVRKQRHSHSTYANSAAHDIAPTAHTRRRATMSYPSGHRRSEVTPKLSQPENSIVTTRAVSLPSSQSNTLHDQATCSLSPVSSSFANHSGPLTKREAYHEHIIDPGSQGVTQREPTLKLRILSRVMNRLTSKPSDNHLVAEEHRQGKVPAKAADSNHSHSQPNQSGRTSLSTVDSHWSHDRKNERDLRVNAEPTISHWTPPTSSTAFEHSQGKAQVHRKLCAPSEITALRPEITIIPEVDIVRPDPNQNLFVAIEISAVADTLQSLRGDQAAGLDVAVIIDNSLFASPATLMANCEAARFLSSLLAPPNDRIAIICTSPLGSEHPDLRTLLPLSLPNPRMTKAIVDRIVSSPEKPHRSALDAAVRNAKALLEQSTCRDQDNGLGPFAYGQIFVLTPNSGGIAQELLNHDKIQLHLISAGSVPWKGEAKVRCNGWKLQSMHTNAFHSISCKKEEDARGLFGMLKATILDARSGQWHGAVNDLILDIKPGRNCSIQGVIGNRITANLQLGEAVVALVRLKVGLPPAGGYAVRSFGDQDNSGLSCNDPVIELDRLLGTTPSTVLRAKLKYTHSLLPSDTQCTVTKDCRLNRQLQPTQWKDVPSDVSTGNQVNHQAEVQKRFAFHIATHHAPRQAMLVLIEDFGDGGRRSACPDYIKLLIEELKYQARIVERFNLADYRSGPVVLAQRESRQDVWGEEHFGQGLFDATNYRPQEWITAVPDEIVIQSPLSPWPASQSQNHQQPAEMADEGRRIWCGQKKKSKRQFAGSVGKENIGSTSAEVGEATKQLQAMVLKRKRSQDAEGSTDVQHRVKTLDPSAPWL
ncbi:MAG: hypothetical protein Q9222_000432 [Ikaeria aurantiellina]